MDTESKPSWLAKLANEADSEESLLATGKKSRTMTLRQRRRCLLVACISLAAVSLIGLFSFSSWNTHHSWIQPTLEQSNIPESVLPLANATERQKELDPLDPLAWVKGPPTARFRDNLRPDVQYLTSWPDSGWTNDVIAYINLIYLALITDRVPIIPVFTPSHVGAEVPPIAFGDVFDVPLLRKLLGKPILEWKDVKDEKSEEVEEIGCWSVWWASQTGAEGPREARVPGLLHLDISYTKMPEWIRIAPDAPADPHTLFWTLARFAYPETRQENLIPPLASPLHHATLPPDEQMLCYDFVYYVAAQQSWEFEKDYSPTWRHVAQHLHWSPRLTKLADEYVNRALGLSENAPTPPYIGIHVRHNDFQDWCFGVELYDCFAKIPVIARRVQEVKDEILTKKGIRIEHVVMTSDERNQTWWKEVADLGWKTPDHSETKAKYGDWYPPLIDAAIQSRGIGFVGTDRSTMSVIAKRRVETWSNGVTRLVRWGTPDADDHET
ncbi:hypothetical protein V5O48_009044 [Marasmius crinis-equi]|uniref:GDP-fucose protein O-fucosyltransferase 2 n=1 Tax=Marasmius crinis-equi TaxID=585013 RepID=A0ABR3FCG5_9AGAR